MRHTSPQLPVSAPWIAHPHAAELAAMSALLDAQPAWAAGIQQDLDAGCAKNPRTGRPGLTGERDAAAARGEPTHRVDVRRAGRSRTRWTPRRIARSVAWARWSRRRRSRRSRRRCAAFARRRSPN